MIRGVVGAMVAVVTVAFLMVAGAGVFWLYIFGDDPWPDSAETGLVVFALILGAASGIATFVALGKARSSGTSAT